MEYVGTMKMILLGNMMEYDGTMKMMLLVI